ncbi:MAG: hypothetical protein M3O15_13760, partial [Acidobacteriota bacterium]|nr:hypothetical protein [Acidobacteriota bacterium]
MSSDRTGTLVDEAPRASTDPSGPTTPGDPPDPKVVGARPAKAVQPAGPAPSTSSTPSAVAAPSAPRVPSEDVLPETHHAGDWPVDEARGERRRRYWPWVLVLAVTAVAAWLLFHRGGNGAADSGA